MTSISPKFLHVFFILAFVLAGVSPACKFISGEKTFMEICFSDGSLKRVEVPAEYSAVMAKAEKTPQNNGHAHKDSDCGFCFAQSSLSKNTLTAAAAILVNPPAQAVPLGAGSFALKGAQASPFQSRGPPALS
ncbi:MAG: DUF2946 family protein [Alphaproteobacteria bacterium]|nr:DUF2946 family protein [Alphaproteobacteria bacterium]